MDKANKTILVSFEALIATSCLIDQILSRHTSIANLSSHVINFESLDIILKEENWKKLNFSHESETYFGMSERKGERKSICFFLEWVIEVMVRSRV